MKKVLLLFVFILQCVGLIQAQTIENGVLKSWGDAKGAITIPAEVTEIAENCFYTPGEEGSEDGWGGGTDPVSNTDITSVDFNNVKIIGKNAFNGCTGITSIVANKVENISEGAFSGCNSLASLSLPAVVSIGKKAFAYCNEITSISLGNTLANIEGNPFLMCTSVGTLEMADGGKDFKTMNNALIRLSDKALVSLAGAAKEIVLPEADCSSIGEEAMYGCQNLQKIDLAGVVEIGNKALTNCRALSELFVPNLKNVIDNSYITWSGVGALSVVDIHLSKDFNSFGNSVFPDKETTTIYVASDAIKTKLSSVFKKCKIVVGAPGELKKYKVTYTCNEGGVMEAWTTGGINVESGQEVNEGSLVRIKATPRSNYEIESWKVNGKILTETLPTEGTCGQIYTVSTLGEPLNVVVTFKEKPQSYVIFFRSRAPEYGTLTCKTEKGEEVKSAGTVPVGSKLTFTATPRDGFRVTEWYREVTNGTESSYVTISGQMGLLTYTCDAVDAMEIQVDFERNANTHVVKYESLNKFATITATADGTDFKTGAAIKKGAKVVFTAHPIEGYSVDSWLLDGEVIIGEKNNTYIIESLNSDVQISLICSEAEPEKPNKPVINGEHLVSWQPVGPAVTPDGVTIIDTRAFEGANKMTSFLVSKDVKSIGELAFLYCVSLEKINVDPLNPYFTEIDGVVYTKDKTKLVAYPIGRKVTTYEIPATAKGIMPGAFASNFYLTEITVAQPNADLVADKGILYSADKKTLIFHPIPNHKEVEIIPGVETIARYGFAFSPVLEKLKFPETLKKIEALGLTYNMVLSSIGWKEGATPQLEEIGDSAFYQDISLLSLPYIASLKKIGEAAFMNGLLLEEIHIPAGCTIGNNAFRHCQALKHVYAYDKTPQVIADDMFDDIEFINEATLYVPKGSGDLYKNAAGWKYFVQINPTITGIEAVNAEGNDISVTRQNGGFVVKGMSFGQQYALYTIDGKLILKGQAISNETFIPANNAKICVLKVKGGKAIKLM